MEENKNGFCKNCQMIAPGHTIRVNNMEDRICADCGKRIYLTGYPASPDLLERCQDIISSGGSIKIGTISATAISVVQSIHEEAPRARMFLKLTGATLTPDRVKENLKLSCSASTLGRKFRAASVGANPELLRTYYVNDKGRRIAQYAYNPDYQEAK